MSEFIFENQGTNTYLVYQITQDDVIDTMSLGMLTNNKIPGLASTMFTQMDATRYIKYNVSAKIAVSQFFSGAVNKKRMLGVFKGIVNALLSVEDYMIDEDAIVLDLDYIFADVSTCDTVLICLPVQGCAQHHDLGAFFKTIMFSTQFDQTENCDYVARIINYLNSTPLFSLLDFKELLDSIESAPQPVAPQPVAPQPVAPQPVAPQPAQPVVTPPDTMQTQPVAQGQFDKGPMNIPVANPQKNQQPVGTPVPAQPQAVKPEKKMSMFNLLMHYNKENAELYKAQKAAKKNAAPNQPAAPAPAAPKKVQQTGFAIPGSNNNGFAIPGSNNNGFAIPGQNAPTAPASMPQAKTQEQPKFVQPAQPIQPIQPIQAAQQAQPVFMPPEAPKGHAANFGETTVLSGGTMGETTVLGAVPVATQIEPHLIRTKNNEKIPLNKPVFRIGKERSYVDYFVSDNTAISRGHANIVNHNGEFFVVDTNSTNHTYVNGAMIQSGVETKLTHGDKIRLANEDFEFKLH